jgi:hypothetical protein
MGDLVFDESGELRAVKNEQGSEELVSEEQVKVPINKFLEEGFF